MRRWVKEGAVGFAAVNISNENARTKARAKEKEMEVKERAPKEKARETYGVGRERVKARCHPGVLEIKGKEREWRRRREETGKEEEDGRAELKEHGLGARRQVSDMEAKEWSGLKERSTPERTAGVTREFAGHAGR